MEEQLRILRTEAKRASQLKIGPLMTLLLGMTQPLYAATFAVTTNADSGAGSLRQAISDANSTGGGDVIDCQITNTTPIVLSSGLPAITEEVNVQGAGCVIDGNGIGSVLVTVSGTDVTLEDLVIGNGTSDMIRFTSTATDGLVQGCQIGVAADGTTAFSFGGNGIAIHDADDITIGSSTTLSAVPSSCGVGTDCNVIANGTGANSRGIYLQAVTDDITVEGNYVGTDTTGLTAAGFTKNGIRANDHGVARNRLKVKYNVVANGSEQGLYLISTNTLDVTGNYVGLGRDGSTAMANNFAGIAIDSDSTDEVTVIDNVIGSNTGRGIIIADGVNGTDLSMNGDCTIQGNIIGLASDGETDRPHSNVGLAVITVSAAVIGGSGAGEGNVIASSSGATSDGVAIDDVDDLSFDGNYVGTDDDGLLARGNGRYGVYISGVTAVRSFTNNVIGGSNDHGIFLDGSDITGIGGTGNAFSLTGNKVGVGADGTTVIGNAQDGIHIDDTEMVVLGDASSAALANTIANNGRAGVVIAASATVHVHRNSIYANGGLGIDLNDDGLTQNDDMDVDTGPNNQINLPVITRVIEQSGRLFQIEGYLPKGADGLDVYTNTSKDDSGYGEGQTFIERLAVTSTGGASYNGSSLGTDTDATQFTVTTTVAAPAGTTPGSLSFLTQDSTNEITSEFGGFEEEDLDGDGIVDTDDIDIDGDGILNTAENASGLNPAADTDTDMIPDFLDVDFPNNAGCPDVGADGACDTVVAFWDHDQDGAPDFMDLDSDNDSLTDTLEVGHGCADTTPADGVCDGIVGANGFLDSLETAAESGIAALTNFLNTDNTGDPDIYDLDSDGDTEPDVEEAGNDGLDADDDGVLDDGETGSIADADSDGIADSADDNDDAFGYPGLSKADVAAVDADSDGIPDHVDTSINSPGDTDGDGLPDPLECAGGWPCPDSDANGVPNYLVSNPVDTDGDGVNDITDVDDDNDGILDTAENADGLNPNADADSDGIPNHLDPQATSPACTDTTPADGVCDAPSSDFDVDGDGTANHLDTDADGDGVNDNDEMGLGPDANDDGEIDGAVSGTGAPTTTTSGIATDPDGDGLPNFLDTDSDGDGTSDGVEVGSDPTSDADNDGIPDHLDSDNNDPCAPDNTTSACTADADGDGTPDHQDSDDSDPCAPDDTATACTADADGDGTPDHQDSDDADPCVPDTDATGCSNGDGGSGDGDGDGGSGDGDGDGSSGDGDGDGGSGDGDGATDDGGDSGGCGSCNSTDSLSWLLLLVFFGCNRALRTRSKYI